MLINDVRQRLICIFYLYHSRLKMLNLVSLELRRLRADLLLVYKILFCLLHTNTETLFTLRAHAQLRGHQYMLEKQRCTNSIRHMFFCNRVVNIWNSLPSDTTDFSSLLKFRRSVSSEYLLSTAN